MNRRNSGLSSCGEPGTLNIGFYPHLRICGIAFLPDWKENTIDQLQVQVCMCGFELIGQQQHYSGRGVPLESRGQEMAALRLIGLPP